MNNENYKNNREEATLVVQYQASVTLNVKLNRGKTFKDIENIVYENGGESLLILYKDETTQYIDNYKEIEIEEPCQIDAYPEGAFPTDIGQIKEFKYDID